MANENLHVVTHEENGWAVKREGVSEPVSTHRTQKEAVTAAVNSCDDDSVSVTIHRRDGRIREVKTVNGDSSSESQTSTPRRTRRVNELTNLGSRIRWGAVAAGFFVAMAMSVALTALGVALAVSFSSMLSAESLGVFVGVWVTVTLLASLFVGGITISQLTIGESDVYEPSIYGVVLWALMIFVAPLVPAAGANFGFGSLESSRLAMQQTNQQESDANSDETVTRGQSPDENADSDAANNSDEATTAAEEMKDTMQQARQEIATPVNWEGLEGVEVAWMTFVAVILSLGASVSGAVLGSQLDRDEELIASAKH
ncbi:DUF2188 domain-containing protein [Thalassoglobus sp. JC818]|uniref:DUF2188 domain-containing protein n=1 Tax=Thalassoglobus sp. JC818 TaxID=3232136 RepID=UPI003458A66C